MYIISAIVLGLMGSFHCVGMCGPIALALPLNNKNWFTRIFGSLLYNVGRAITYSLMGAVFGILGEGLQLGGFQRWISVLMGSVMVLAVVFPALFRGSGKMDKYLYGYNARLKNRFGVLFTQRSYSSLLIIGLLNGLLPCGLVYMALAGAIATGGVASGALFMFIFGLGTLPMLLLLSLAGNVVTGSFKSSINKIIPYVIVIIGILFILRGLNLGIPFISPPEDKLHPNDKPMKMEKKLNDDEMMNISTIYFLNEEQISQS
ncbi:MAG: sulfite exporter TauE/SafE family protein [Bacteroidales bacterium]|jgi:sulfite exporter TauE/SafE|nr:sulfite exporter TauE/SafE family protein [Bacteroidales bacterium]